MSLILFKENGHTGPRLQCDKYGLIAKEPWDITLCWDGGEPGPVIHPLMLCDDCDRKVRGSMVHSRDWRCADLPIYLMNSLHMTEKDIQAARKSAELLASME
jgi:hypothetical protein